MRFLALLLIALCSSVSAQMTNPGVVPSAAMTAGNCLQATGPYSIGTTGSPCGSGSGSVTGPTESTQNGVAAFSNTTGTGIEDTGIQYTNLGLLSGTQTWTGTNTFAGVAKAVSFQSFGGGSSLTDAGVSAPNVVTSTLTIGGNPFSPANYLTTAAAASTYLTQTSASSTYLPINGGAVNGFLNYNAAGSVFRGISLNWSGTPLWKIGSDSAQTGSNNGGGDLDFYAYADNGDFLGNSAVVTRATRTWNFVNRPVFGSATPWDSSNLPSPAAQNLAGSPWYVSSPYLRNSQLAAGIGTVLFSFIAPRAMTLVGAVGYTDTLSAAAVPVLIAPTSPATAAVASLSFFNNANKATFSWITAGSSLALSAGDRVYVTTGFAANGAGSMDGVSITLIFTLN